MDYGDDDLFAFTRWITVFALAQRSLLRFLHAQIPGLFPLLAQGRWRKPFSGCLKIMGDRSKQIAKKYNVGFLALLQANPGVDPYVPRAGSVDPSRCRPFSRM